MSTLRALWSLVRAELVQLLRTRETWFYLLGPLAVGLPVIVVAVQLWLTALPNFVVGIPSDCPLQPELGEHFDEDGVSWIELTDPEAALHAGEVDQALRVEEGHETRWRLTLLHARGRTPGVEDAIEDAAELAFAREVRDAGGGKRYLEPIAVRRIDANRVEKTDDPFFRRATLTVLTILLFSIGVYLIPAQVISDRNTGVIETMASTGSRLELLWLARVVAATTCQGLGLGLAFVSLWTMEGSFGELLPPVSHAARVLSAVMALNTGLVLASLAARTIMGAWNTGTGLMLIVGLPLVWDAPWWVPIIGPLCAPDGALGWAATATNLVFTTVVLLVASRYLQSRRLFPDDGGGA